MIRPILILALTSLLALSACGDDDGDGESATQTQTVAAAGDADRYCELTRSLDKQGEKFFAGLDERSTEAEFQAAERRSVEAFADEFEELKRVAPPEIRTDVPKLLAGIQKRAGLQPDIEVTQRQSSAAEERISAFEKRECAS